MVPNRKDARVVLVTGGGRGVGEGIADAFLADGAQVVVCGRTEPSGARPDRWTFITADVRKPDQMRALFVDMQTRFGHVDVVVNNAGGSPPADTATVSPRFTQAIVGLNLVAPFSIALQANALMQQQDEGGSIINIGSLTGLRPAPGTAAYGAAKAGIMDATAVLAAAFGPKVRVNCVTPGAIETEQLESDYGGRGYIETVAATVPMGRMGQPADVAAACVFLSSRDAAFITGANLLVHGGGDDPPAVTGPAPPD